MIDAARRSDGLFRYAKRDDIVRLVHDVDLRATAQR
jgi:hypothetical protein